MLYINNSPPLYECEFHLEVSNVVYKRSEIGVPEYKLYVKEIMMVVTCYTSAIRIAK